MKNEKRQARETFTFSHAIVKPNLPAAISTERYMENFAETAHIEAGFFDTASPDFSKYYPDVTAEDLEPKDDEFYAPLVRALSKVTVNKYGPIDFGDGNILKKSMGLLAKQTVYPNHEVMVGNHLGVVTEVAWQNETTVDGKTIPAGINARLKIDGKSNPNIVRGMRMEPPAIHSLSVGVSFDWEKSHPSLSDNDFWAKLGTFDKEGQLIKRVVSEIIAFHEISLVPHGADPYAQVISSKGINNADYAQRVHQYDKTSIFSFGAEDFTAKGHFHDYNEAYQIETVQLDNTQSNINTNNSNTNNSNFNSTQMNKELQEFLNSLRGVESLGLSEGANSSAVLTAVQSAVENLATANEQIQTLTSARDTAQTELATANASLEANKPKVVAFEAVLKATKAEATRLYTLAKGDNASTDMLEMIAGCETFDQAKTFLNQYQKDTENQFAGSCGDCGSNNVTRMSAAAGDEGVLDDQGAGSGDEGNGDSKLSTDDVFAKLQSQSYDARSIHGETSKETK